MTNCESEKLKEQGNEAFKKSKLKEALEYYSQGIKLTPLDNKPLLTALYKNRAAVYLKNENYKAAEQDCSKALDLTPHDPKSLFRRCQSLIAQDKIGEAYKDCKMAIHLEPNNKAVQALMTQLVELNQKKAKEAHSTENRVAHMFKLAFNQEEAIDKRIQALNNMVVLSREPTGSAILWSSGAAEKLLTLIGESDNEEMALGAQRVIDELAKDEDRAQSLLTTLDYTPLVRMMNKPGKKNIMDAAAVLVQRIFNALAGMDRKEGKKPDKERSEKNKVPLTKLILELEDLLMDASVCAHARENAIDMLTKNLMHMDGGIPRGFSWRFLEDRGLRYLLELCCYVPEKTKVPITGDTRQHLAICLTKLWEDMVFDTKREIFKGVCEKFLSEKIELTKFDPSVRIQICAMIATMLQGPVDIGFTLLGSHNITEMMLEMAAIDDFVYQSVAADLIVQSCSKRDKASQIVSQGVTVLKKLFQSKNESIKARSLVGLCKCASAAGDDCSRKTMSEGSEIQLATACKKMLLSGTKSIDVKRWAAEGLSYLTLDADVKEELVLDKNIIRTLVTLAKEAGPICVFGVASIFVNLTNSYEKPDVQEEMVKLAQFAKHHVPEEHPKDMDDFIAKRIEILVKEGATSACVAIGNTTSPQCRELLARCLTAFTSEKSHRGTVVSEGGAKLLLSLALDNNEKGKAIAAQGLARIGIKMDPEICFPGQRAYEVVRPLMNLLHCENSGLQNYEALLTLTNLASTKESVRKRIWREKDSLAKIDEYWFMQDHRDLRDAAAELMLNLVHCKEVCDSIVDNASDRLKLFLLYSVEEEEDRLNTASTSALAILTQREKACIRLTNEVGSWLEALKELCLKEDPELQYRGLIVVANMMNSDRDVCAKIVQSQIFELLVVITKMDDPVREKGKKEAIRGLKAAEKWEFIKPTDREIYERDNDVSTLNLKNINTPAIEEVDENEENEN